MKINILTIVLFCSLTIKAQQISKTPKSIYTLNLDIDENGFSALNKRLKLNDYHFSSIDAEDIINSSFSIPLRSLGEKPSEFIYDDYLDYQNNNFLKRFLDKYDISRWQPQELKLQ